VASPGLLRQLVAAITEDDVSIEAFIVSIGILLAFAFPTLGSNWFSRIERGCASLARKKTLSLILTALLCIGIRVALLPLLPAPVPGIHDEYSYLLAADTFAHGRLTNPTPAMWQHFESFHIILQPSYASKFPPAQGLILAMGKSLAGSYWAGVLISSAVMCAAICWMLQGWLPPGWALFGGLLAVLRLGTLSYWTNSYWGGAVAAVGGAIVLGALPRLKRRPLAIYALLMGIGLAILANSRPYEGFLLAIPVGVSLLVWMVGRRSPPRRILLLRVLLPLSLVLVITAASMGYYNWRVAGSPLVFPHHLNQRQYAVAPLFVWSSPNPVAGYRHIVMQNFYVNWELAEYTKIRTIPGFLDALWSKISTVLSFFFGPALFLPLVMLPWALRDRRIRFLVWVVALASLGLVVEVRLHPHYVAPITAAIYALLFQCMRHLRLWKWKRRPVGKALVRTVAVACILVFGIWIGASARGHRLTIGGWTWDADWPGNLERAKLEKTLRDTDGPDLVIVRYSPGHNYHHEWVYNDADIEGSDVIWAREMDDASNQELIHHFQGRLVWLLESDEKPAKLTPYPNYSQGNR
jgi:hypothetical protein